MVLKEENYVYSSAIDYAGEKGLLDDVKDLEQKLGESVISPLNAKELGKREDYKLEK